MRALLAYFTGAVRARVFMSLSSVYGIFEGGTHLKTI